MTHENMTISEKWRWRFLTIWVVIFTVLTAYGVYLGSNAHKGVCAFVDDLATRHDAAVTLLTAHQEDPVRIYGLEIPRDLLLKQARDQESVLMALETAKC